MIWRSMSLRKRLLVIMTLTGLVELFILVMAGFWYVKETQEQEMGSKALGVAELLASSQVVKQLIQQDVTNLDQLRFRKMADHLGAAFIVIGDRQGIRRIHPVDERIGKPMKGGDNVAALQNGESYVSIAEGSLGRSVRGKAAVFDDDGQIIGVVSVGYLLESLQERLQPFLMFLSVMALLVVCVNAVVSSYASRRYQRTLLGFEPEEIGRLYSELDATLATIKEGIITIDNQGRLRSINRRACDILELDSTLALNQPLSHILPGSDLLRVLEQGEEEHNVELIFNNISIIANRSPVWLDGEVIGAVSSFRLKDEMTELTQQLAQTKAYAELLRSQTHEHRNKLNTISGLVQMGELESVQHLIGQETAHYQSLIEFLREAVKDPLIAGMLLGKSERARELGLELVVEEGSCLQPLPLRVRAEDMVTVLGNIIDNAFDAVMTAIQQDPLLLPERRIVEVSVSDYGQEIVLEVTDSGCGLPEEMSLTQLLVRGVSTKSKKERGVGLHLVNQITRRYQGSVEMLSNGSEGTRVTVYIPKEEVS